MEDYELFGETRKERPKERNVKRISMNKMLKNLQSWIEEDPPKEAGKE